MSAKTKAEYIRKHSPFFCEWGSQCYMPDKETQEQGRQRGASMILIPASGGLIWGYSW